jgi:geranylgeranyl pyrophosphate synthase
MTNFALELEQQVQQLLLEAPIPLQTPLRDLLARKGLGSLWSDLMRHTATVWEVPAPAALAVGAALRCFFTAANWLDDVIDREVEPAQIPAVVNGSTGLLALGQAALLRLNQPLPILELVNRTWLWATAGEQLDLSGADATEQAYIEQARLKTGVPLATTCLAIALQAENQPLTAEERVGLDDFGTSFGIVCQIENDLSALSPLAQNKTDLADLKNMLPLIFLRDKISPAAYTDILARACQNDLLARHALFDLLEQNGALAYGQLIAHLHMQQAVDALTATSRGTQLARLLNL